MIAAVLGAGYMGSAITFPLIDAGHQVRLWGTWLDDDIIEQCMYGDHPKLNKKLPDKVQLFDSRALGTAIVDADAVFIAVTSEGFVPVFERYLAEVSKLPPGTEDGFKTKLVCALTKGFVRFGGCVSRISEAAEKIYREKCGILEGVRWVSVGGPVKAVELSDRVLTATVYASTHQDALNSVLLFASDYYRVCTVQDVCGVELSSALKNVYAVAVGICEGMYRASGFTGLSHNFKALVFNQALREMALLAEKAGARRETVFDLAGIGDLYVTSASGRNGRLGELVGKGIPPAAAYESMKVKGEYAEGYNTLKAGYEYAQMLGIETAEAVPLLEALHGIVFRGINCTDAMGWMVQAIGRGP